MQIHPSTYIYWQVRSEVLQLALLQAAATKAGGQARSTVQAGNINMEH